MPIVDKRVIKDFVDRWKGRGREDEDSQQFWLQLLRSIGYEYCDSVLFEKRVSNGGKIDVWLRESGVLIEQKSISIDLNRPELRQGQMKTPLQQALDYAEDLRLSDQPNYIVTSNFRSFRVYDRTKYGRSELEENAFEFSLEEFGDHPEYFGFITDPRNSRLEKEKEVSIRAGELIGQLYDMLLAAYYNSDSEETLHALNVLCVRLVFCLYCEDADLFEKDSFLNYLKNVPAEDVRPKLKNLFRALNTPIADRDPYDTGVMIFPYVNGGLFGEETEIPNFSQEMQDFLLNEVSAPVDWSKISPTIFGGIFESTLNPETRRSGGMHYTSPENIHKVIDPLFLDDLKKEFASIRDEVGMTPRKRKNALKKFHERICNMKFFDPACGSGNFLTETYICLRKLEDAVLRELRQGQITIGFGDENEIQDKVNLGQFYGIEINDFAVTVAEAALWISRLKANGETQMFMELGGDDFPLHESAHIFHGNALRIDWNDVLPAAECSFIIGNPPFVGSSRRTDAQTEDMSAIAFAGMETWGKIDYCGAWYYMAAKYMSNWPISAAFVSTNSLCQGEQVQPMWEPLFKTGIHINFAWKTFIWDNEASEKAHVHCVIIGFGRTVEVKEKRLFENDLSLEVVNINGYLSPAPNVFLRSRGAPIDDQHLKMTQGSKPVDGGNLILSYDVAKEFLSNEETAAFVHEYIGAQEFMKNKKRFVLWLKDVGEEAARFGDIAERFSAISAIRASSPTKEFQKYASQPWLFVQDRQPTSNYLVLPRTTSGRRRYVPLGFFTPDIVASDKLIIMPNASLYDFGLLSSLFHAAWMRVVSGRLKSDYEYSSGVYNNMAYPDPTPKQRESIEHYAQGVLDARNNHPNDSLATLYDPEKMPVDLFNAHQELDRAVEDAYNVSFNGDEEKIVAHLFKLYAAATQE